MAGNILDRLVGWLNPERGQRRLAARVGMANASQLLTELGAIDAGKANRTTRDWSKVAYSADQNVIDASDAANARARTAAVNDWAVSSAVRAAVRCIVGDGITAVSTARDAEGKPNEEWNKAADRYWKRWIRDKNRCDLEHKRTFLGLERLWAREFCTVGETFVRIIRRSDGDITLQTLEPEQLDTMRYEYEGRYVKGGVEVDDYGAPVAYWFFEKQHPLEGYGYGLNTSTRFPADTIIHYFDPERVRQTRGLTSFSPVLSKAWHMQAYDNYQVIKARLEACIAAVVETDPRYSSDSMPLGLSDPNNPTGKDANLNNEFRFEPGYVGRVAPGQRVNFTPPVNPGANYAPFRRQQLHDFAAGCGWDYPTISRDYSGNTYAGQREGKNERDKDVDATQEMMIDLLLRPIRRAVLEQAIIAGRLQPGIDLSDPDELEELLCDEWRGPRKAWIDPLKEAQAIVLLLGNHLTTLRDELNERGLDLADVLHQRAEETQAIRDAGMTPAEKPVPQPAAVDDEEDDANTDTEPE